MASIAVSARSRVGAWRPDQVSLALLGFSVALALFLLVPPFFHDDVGWVPHFTGQEAADLLTPIVAMPLFALVLELIGRSGTGARLILLALVAAWVAGQGIHLAANAIGDVFPAGPEREAFYATPVGTLDHFLDEELSHWLWHAAWGGLLLLLLWAGAARPVDGTLPGGPALALASAAGVVHGFTVAVVTDEGGTWLAAIPFTVLLLVLAVLVRRPDGSGRVVTRFLVVGSLVTLVLYAVWIAYAGWPPVAPCDRIAC